MRIALILVITLVIGLFGCSSTDEEPDRPYLRSETLPPLKIPEGLRTPKGTHTMAIPYTSAETEVPIKDLEIPPNITGVEPSIEADLAESEIPLSIPKPMLKTKPQNDTLVDKSPLPSRIQANDDGIDQLIVSAEMDKVWPRIAGAVKRLGFLIEERSRGNQVYMIYRDVTPLEDFAASDVAKIKEDFARPPEMVKSNQDTQSREDYQIKVVPDSSQTTVTIRTRNGELDGSALARHLLVQLKYDLENPILPQK